MSKFTFIVGGVRSGKSSLAVDLAEESSKEVTFIATAIAFDDEMKQRIKLHQEDRPVQWRVVEEPRLIANALLKSSIECQDDGLVIIDCFGVYVTNLLMDDLSDQQIMDNIETTLNAIQESNNDVIVVSNEVGHGIVPDNQLSRRFRDLIGFANQRCAAAADDFIFMQCGIPMKLKTGGKNVSFK